MDELATTGCAWTTCICPAFLPADPLRPGQPRWDDRLDPGYRPTRGAGNPPTTTANTTTATIGSKVASTMVSSLPTTPANLPPDTPKIKAGNAAGGTTDSPGAAVAAGASLLGAAGIGEIHDPGGAPGRAAPDLEPLRSMLARLSHRELQVARLVTRGMTNRQIAVHLQIALGTVTSHLKHIFAKLKVNSRAQLAGWIAAAHAVGVPEEP